MDMWHYAVLGAVAILGAISTGYGRWLTSREHRQITAELKRHSDRLNEVEAAEAKCQRERKEAHEALLASMSREQLLREVMPKEMADNVKLLVGETQRQTKHLEALKDLLGSDAVKQAKATQEEIKTLAIAQGHRLDDIETVLARRSKQEASEGL